MRYSRSIQTAMTNRMLVTIPLTFSIGRISSLVASKLYLKLSKKDYIIFLYTSHEKDEFEISFCSLYILFCDCAHSRHSWIGPDLRSNGSGLGSLYCTVRPRALPRSSS